MADFVITPPPPASVAVAGTSARFPVRRIFCVGRNYAAHAREMGADPDREPPFFFTKPADAVVEDGSRVAYPPMTTDLHHEAELVIAIATGGSDIPLSEALDHVYGYAAGIDLTRRDLQAAAKKSGRPWDMSKGFDASAPIGAIRPVEGNGHVQDAAIRLTVNGETRQDARLADMIWPVADTIAYLSGLVALAPGDLIFTGTPEGVGAVSRGDRLQLKIDGLPGLSITIAD